MIFAVLQKGEVIRITEIFAFLCGMIVTGVFWYFDVCKAYRLGYKHGYYDAEQVFRRGKDE